MMNAHDPFGQRQPIKGGRAMSMMSRLFHKNKWEDFLQLVDELDAVVSRGSGRDNYDQSLQIVERMRALYASMDATGGVTVTPAWLIFCLTVSHPKTPEDVSQYRAQFDALKWWLETYWNDPTRPDRLRRIASGYLRACDNTWMRPRIFDGIQHNPSERECLDRLTWLLSNGCVWEDFRESLEIIRLLDEKGLAPSYQLPPETQNPGTLAISLATRRGYDPERVISTLLLHHGDSVSWWLGYFAESPDAPEDVRELTAQYLLLREIAREQLSAVPSPE
jgi:hypothetical protein